MPSCMGLDIQVQHSQKRFELQKNLPSTSSVTTEWLKIIKVVIITANMHLVLTIRFSHLVLITISGILLKLDQIRLTTAQGEIFISAEKKFQNRTLRMRFTRRGWRALGRVAMNTLHNQPDSNVEGEYLCSRTTARSGCLGWQPIPTDVRSLLRDTPQPQWGSFSLQVVKVSQPAGDRRRDCFSAEKLLVALHIPGFQQGSSRSIRTGESTQT